MKNAHISVIIVPLLSKRNLYCECDRFRSFILDDFGLYILMLASIDLMLSLVLGSF